MSTVERRARGGGGLEMTSFGVGRIERRLICVMVAAQLVAGRETGGRDSDLEERVKTIARGLEQFVTRAKEEDGG